MAVMARETWTDERMDDLAKRVDDGFAQVHTDIAELRAAVERDRLEGRAELKETATELRAEIKEAATELRAEIKAATKELRAEIAELRGEIRAVGEGIDTLQDRFAGLHNILIACLAGGLFTLFAAVLTALAAHLL